MPHGLLFKNGTSGGSFGKSRNTKIAWNNIKILEEKVETLIILSLRITLKLSFINICTVDFIT